MSVALDPGKDGVVQVDQVRTSSAILKCASCILCYLIVNLQLHAFVNLVLDYSILYHMIQYKVILFNTITSYTSG